MKSLQFSHEKYRVKIQAFVLMSNHYHLMLWTPNADIDKFMFEFNRMLSFYVRRRTKDINRIFGDRYHWTLIDNQDYYNNVIRYIYQNPLRAKLVERCEDYPFSTLFSIINNKEIYFSIDKDITLQLHRRDYFNDSKFFEKSHFIKQALSKRTFKPPRDLKLKNIVRI